MSDTPRVFEAMKTHSQDGDFAYGQAIALAQRLERELQEAKELLQEFYDDSPVQNRDFDIWERTEKLLGMESEAENE